MSKNINCHISRNKSTGLYRLSLTGLSKQHVQALRYILAGLSANGIEVVSNNGISLPFMLLETHCPLSRCVDNVLTTQYNLLRDISKCFTTHCDLPEKEKLINYKTFRPLGYEY